MKKFINHVISASVCIAMFGMSSVAIAASANTKDDGLRQINQVVWDKTEEVDFEPMSDADIPYNQANLVFIRPMDKDVLQTSANIGIDGRFQVSLQGGSYSQVLACSGNHTINATTTGSKNNHLSDTSNQVIYIAPKQNHYFYVDVDNVTGSTKVDKISEEMALNVLQNKTQQTHQISRVVAKCKTPTAVTITPPPKTIIPAPTVTPRTLRTSPTVELNKPITLDVLFKFDSDDVQPIYNQRIQDVANYMTRYPNTVAQIQGHTDSIGSSKYNMKLSERRAISVKDELVGKYGADANRVSTIGYGESRPTATNSTPEGRQQNRRVVAIISQR